MSDPFILATVASAVLSEGVKFVFEQAREVLKSWRERRAAKAALPASSSDALNGGLQATDVPAERVEVLEPVLTQLRAALLEYADGGRPIDPADSDLVATVEALRAVLEDLYGQRISFRGEERARTGTRIDGAAEAKVVQGYLAGVRARGLLDHAEVVGRAKAREVHAGGQVVGAEVDFGGSARSED